MSMSSVPSDPKPILLDREPPDISDVREVRHWIRVYTDLLEAAEGAFTPPVSEVLRRRWELWHGRLDFWRGRARELSNPAIQ